MRKWLRKWWWIALVLAAGSSYVGWKESRCQANAYQCRAYYAAQYSRRLSLSINSNASEQQAINAACEPNGYFCRLFSSANLPTWLLVLAGISGIWAALRTLKAIERQADTMINSERPWVLLDERMYPERAHVATEFEFRIHNFGRTPAKIIAMQIDLRFGENETAPPFPEFFDKIQPFNSFILPQGEKLRHEANVASAEGVGEAGNYLWLCGLVRYQDTLESEASMVYETLFCLRLLHYGAPPAWKRGPDKYNKAT